MKLYINPMSPNARKVITVANHLGLEVETQVVDLQKGEQRKPDFLALNPNGMVPTLVDGDLKLWESNAIMCYLASRQDNALWPKNDSRYDIMRWMSWQLAHFGPACDIFIWENMFKKVLGLGEADAARLEEGKQKLERFGGVLNQQLQGQDWLVGKALTLADIAVAAPLTYAQAAQIPLAQFPAIDAWLKRLDEVAAWRDSAPAM